MDAGQMTHPELDALLRWYEAMGVEIAVDDQPHDRFAEFAAEAAKPRETPREMASQPARAALGEPARKVALAPAPMRDPIQKALSASAEDVVRAAQEAAGAAATLDELRAALEAFDGCALKRTASRLVFSDGDPQARIMLVGDIPGEDDDREGKPFCGRMGGLLDLMLASIGLDRGKVYLANVAPWRPPGNRALTPHETAICLPFSRRQIELVAPDYLVCLGAGAVQALLGAKDGIGRARARAYEYELGGDREPRNIRAFAMLHPTYLLKQPANKKYAWTDLRAFRKVIEPQ
ncbi:MAG: uracil-DNA glycosylase [Beijerinckiaceae bacterium]|nr:uracil-DNA glycosylase [Beijerinckiaceae bacterium]